ncbi:MAG: hypothetical protein AAFR60_06845 [Pseudomonadota bacterium]
MTLLLIGLGIVALAGLGLLILGFGLRRENITVTGTIAQVLGLASIATAVGLYYLPDLRGNPNAELEAQLKETKAELSDARTKAEEAAKTAVAKLAMQKALVVKAQDRTKAVTARLKAADARRQKLLEVERARLKALLATTGEANPAHSATQSTPVDLRGKATHETNQATAERLEEEIVKLAQLIRRKKDIDDREPADFQKVAKLRDRMNFGFQTEHFGVEVYPDTEVVKGKTGKYYVIDIKNAETGARFQFGGGKYTLSRDSRSFRRGLQSFMKEVVTTIEGNLDYVLFVRGSADSVPYSGRHENGYDYRQVKYMRSVGDGKYVNDFGVQAIGQRVRNKDLPFLRAEFLRSVITEVYPAQPAIVLEGKVTDARSNEDRNAELILYVNW